MRFLWLIALFTLNLWAQQRSEAFLVDIYDRKISVVSPKKHTKNLHAIFTNNSLTKLLGKVQLSDKSVVGFVTLEPGESDSVIIGPYKNKKIFYIPLAPAFQEIELQIGRTAYEIPPKG